MSHEYSHIEPYEHGYLDVGDGHRVYWETCGNPDGKPALALHGGPGSGCTPGMRRLFDPNAYRIVLLDQRGVGRSTPHASDASIDLTTNTTSHLIEDLERIREHLEIDRWLVFGRSWGCTLGLAYAEAHPRRVTEMVLSAVTMTRRSEIDWLYRGVSRFFPEQWSLFRDAVPASDRDGNLVHAYAKLLNHEDATVRNRAAVAWCEWEDAVVSLESGGAPNPRYNDPRFRIAFARIVTHYFSHGAWLEEGQILQHAHRLSGIRGVLIHGRLDLASPLSTAWELSQAWPESTLVILENTGHTSSTMADQIVAAIDSFSASH